MFTESHTDLYTVAELAEHFYTSKGTIYKLIHSHELPAVRVGRSWLIPRFALEDFIKNKATHMKRD